MNRWDLYINGFEVDECSTVLGCKWWVLCCGPDCYCRIDRVKMYIHESCFNQCSLRVTCADAGPPAHARKDAELRARSAQEAINISTPCLLWLYLYSAIACVLMFLAQWKVDAKRSSSLDFYPHSYFPILLSLFSLSLIFTWTCRSCTPRTITICCWRSFSWCKYLWIIIINACVEPLSSTLFYLLSSFLSLSLSSPPSVHAFVLPTSSVIFFDGI